MNALYFILSLLFGINVFGFSPSAKSLGGVQNMNDKVDPTIPKSGRNDIINANPGTVVVLDDTHFSPPR